MGDGLKGRARVRAETRERRPEWPTLALIVTVHGGWLAVLMTAGTLGPLVSALLLVPLLTLHSSLQHEATHGHPFGDGRDDLVMGLPLGLAIPFARFKAMHLAHHHDPHLTDPYDDPEANYLDPVVWARLPWAARAALAANNTLLGRMVIGPALGTGIYCWGEARAILAGDRRVEAVWWRHAALCAAVLWAVWLSALPAFAYLAACYGAMSVLRIRTFLEHEAAHAPRERSVVIEDRGPLAFLFLNNNFHALHHARPGLPWYVLPRAYADEREGVLRRNGNYRYRSYGEVFRRHLLRPKDPVPHPLWTGGAADPVGRVPRSAPRPGAVLARSRVE